MEQRDHISTTPDLHPVRAWLAVLAILLLAMLPGPDAPQRADQIHQLVSLQPELLGTQGRELAARHDATPLRPLPPVAMLPQGLVPPPLPETATGLARPETRLLAAHAPPMARARAPPLS